MGLGIVTRQPSHPLWERAGARACKAAAYPLRRLFASSAGFTLVEMLVGIGLLSIVTTMFGGGLFQASAVQRFWRDESIATKEWRHAGSWFARDSLNAQSTDLTDGAPPASSVTLTWTVSGVTHTANYAIVNGALVRTFDGKQLVVAHQAVSATFALSGNVLTFDLAVQADRGRTQRSSLNTYLRALQ